MSNETFLIPLRQNNQLSEIAVAELKLDLEEHPLHQRNYVALASLPGNSRKYSLQQFSPNPASPLFGKRILFLGSSVTFGFGALGESFVDDLWRQEGVRAVKDAENGTTLVDHDRFRQGDSYVGRFDEDLTKQRPDAFVLQVSTNDATLKEPLGQMTDGKASADTITGALQYMITKAQKKWHCPILLFTNPDFGNGLYRQMVKRSYQLARHYQLTLLDMNRDSSYLAKKSLYMADAIHPTRAGYLEKWTPAFSKKLGKILA